MHMEAKLRKFTWMRSTLLAHAATFIPALANFKAVAAPIPELAPVTSATRPFHRSIDLNAYIGGIPLAVMAPVG